MRGEGYSLSDIAAATGNGSNGGFGDGYGWWIIIIIILFGWGRGNYGGFGGSDSGAANNYVLASDFATLQRQLSDGFNAQERKLDSITNGLCDGFYTNAQLINGVNTNILTTGNNITSQIAEVGFGIKDCCCQQLRAIDSVNFNNAQNTCAITNTLNMNTRDIIDNQNANYRALHDEIINFRIQDKDQQIANQASEISALRLAASQAAQNEYLLNSLRNGCPVNATLVNNTPIPVQYIAAGCGCNGYNNGCGC